MSTTSAEPSQLSNPSPGLISERYRNREYARKTRERKKVVLNAMQTRFLSLQEELVVLQGIIIEKTTASILLKMYEKTTISDNFSNNSVDSTSSNTGKRLAKKYEEDSDIDGTKGTRSDNNRLDPSWTEYPENSILSDWEDGLNPDLDKDLSQVTKNVSKILEKTSKSSLDKDAHMKALEQLSALIGTLTSHEYKNAFISDKRYTMPKAKDLEGEFDHSDPKKLELFKKERNRLHAKITRERKRLISDMLDQTNEHLEQTIVKIKQSLTHLGIPSGLPNQPDVSAMAEDSSNALTTENNILPSAKRHKN